MPKQLSETAREREFYKYLSPQTCGSYPWVVAGSVAESSHDTSLTAFAQLGALRLNAKRCIISLFDRTQQFVIAEATQTLSLQSDLVHDAGDALWLGTTVLPKESGICQLVVDMPSNAPCPDDPDSRGVIVVPDLAEDDRFANMPFVVKKPFTRFYAGVPICSPKGAHIGSYCVMHDVPREDIGPEHCQFMKDMAITVMAHLELARSREEHRRGERLVRGLGSFVEGKSTLRNWRGGATVADRTYEPSRVDFGGEGQLNVQQQDLQKAQDEIVISLDRSSASHGSVTTDAPHFQSISTQSTAGSVSEQPLPLEQTPSPYLTPASTPPHSPSPEHTLRGLSRHSTSTSRQPSVDLQESMLSLNVKQTFSRAANIIRESMEVEGAIFLDASIGSFGGMVSGVSSASETSASPAPSSGGESDKSLEERMSGILGFSTTNNSSINGDFTSQNALPIPEKFLKGLLRRHPKGKIYYFDEEGHISSSDSSGEDSSKRVGRSGFKSTDRSSHGSSAKRKKARKRFSKFCEAETLIKTFPGARCIALIPLWDNHRERWFSGGIVWTNTPKRVFTSEGELSYLSAFSSIIMAEVARLDASTSDKAKTDLLGSISHELRSPLHGILGSVEMLEDSAVTAFQGNMVHTIETCGRTLLDTVDHLLDFTKINHFMEVSKRRRTHGSHNNTQSAPRSKIGSDMMAMSARVQLDVITEEVVAAVSAGYDTQKRAKANSSPQKKKPKLRHANNSASRPHDASYSSDRYGDAQINTELREYNLGGVIVILDIDKDVDWAFSTQAGAWRRIVMNLFANSLKYTARGYIRVSLKAKPLPMRHGVSRSKITLVVTDSGKGMSRDYLRGRLFQPFAQEDRLSPGTGLGLSIIRQIILSQGGKIDVQSVQDEGTQVTVTLPLAQAAPEINGPTQIEDSCLGKVYEQTKTLSACLIGVEIGAETIKPRKPSVPFQIENDGPQALKSSLQEMCKNWFGLRLDTKQQTDRPSDLYLVVETPFNTDELTSGKLLAEIPKISPDQSEQLQPIVIVLCRSAASACALQHIDSQGRVVEYLSQPCGPRKLAKALNLCFERRTAGKKSVPSSSTVSTLLEAPPLGNDAINQFGFPSTSSVATDATGYYADMSDTEFPLSPTEIPISIVVMPDRPPPTEQSSSDVTETPELEVHKGPGPFLIVDDNHINVKILAAFMRKSKYSYRVAEDGAIAFDVYKANPEACRIIFMDISMPVMDGLTSTRLIRAYERLHKLKPAIIILLTGLASASVQQEANASGADLFLTKPVRLRDLGKILLDMGK
ncbi:uncharacterized protein BDZ99DRAFT_493882 [Mytilinidion resinicola]|uniref:histidine kinase n=1 Tax=Mytilinidion resinicola TaxID=574789 RepID=A0A6A6Z6N0_9PEZI|nr:uncharacterized protein BDZ99DRAFT_493882 [Mytilinidion resinicola]KAF2815954.1 hypothetical protein BDZ99DRAFT_493882 [Mytilinidion resinicola]